MYIIYHLLTTLQVYVNYTRYGLNVIQHSIKFFPAPNILLLGCLIFGSNDHIFYDYVVISCIQTYRPGFRFRTRAVLLH